MKALIIGGAGFVGYYLTDHLFHECGWSVFVTKLENEVIEQKDVSVYNLDILDRQAIIDILKEVRPDFIFHLAAQSSVALSWKEPALTVDVNVKGSINVLDAIRDLDYKPRILLIGSGEEYGNVLPIEIPIREDNHTRPGNIYAATKTCQNMIGKIYADAYDMNIIMVRAFNHIGPRQSPMFVVADFCKQVAEIEKGIRESIIRVGNLNVKRDFTDVRDVVRAYSILIQKGKTGETYNVGSGKAVGINNILDLVLEHSHIDIKVETDAKKIRPIDLPIIEANISKLHECTGWLPTISLDKTITDTIEYWRAVI
ncbi:MAG: GDP-mannose 4,6-dehydratase [Lachnoclostridium sp.]|jgi:GDP-4-dehydro-6-deoxy-D-mannose reductase